MAKETFTGLVERVTLCLSSPAASITLRRSEMWAKSYNNALKGVLNFANVEEANARWEVPLIEYEIDRIYPADI